MVKLDWMADEFRAAGLRVEEHTGWKSRTMEPFSSYTPVGMLDHHTAGRLVMPNYPFPPYYSNRSLETKCNITIQPTGLVIVLNAGWAYDSGMGSSTVLDLVRNNKPLPSLIGLKSNVGGNRWFIDVEVQHLGNGSPLPKAARTALIIVNGVVCKKMGWNPAYRLIGHREWAPDRKIDPRWDGFTNPMPKIRQDTINYLEGDIDMATAKEVVDELMARLITVDSPAGKRSFETIIRSLRYDAQLSHGHAKKAREYAASILAEVRGFSGVDVDEAEIARLVLAGLPAELVISAVPEEIAQQVLDGLHARLQS